MKPVTPSADLAEVVGSKPMPRTEVTKKLWAYIKKNGLQDAKNKRMIKADAAPEAGVRRQGHGQHVRDDQVGQQAPAKPSSEFFSRTLCSEITGARVNRAPFLFRRRQTGGLPALSSPQVLSRPALEHHQREQRVGVILAAGDVLVHQPRHLGGIEQPAPARCARATAGRASAAAARGAASSSSGC